MLQFEKIDVSEGIDTNKTSASKECMLCHYWYFKYVGFIYGGKNLFFVIKDYAVLDKYNEIWDKNKTDLNIKFHSMPVYDERYIKAKVREFNGVIKTN